MRTLAQSNTTPLPLLIQFTPYERVAPAKEAECVYDEFNQIVIHNPMTCATSSMKTWWTNKNGSKKTDHGMKKVD